MSKSQVEKKDEMMRTSLSESTISKSNYPSHINTNPGDTENEIFSKNEVNSVPVFLRIVHKQILTVLIFVLHTFLYIYVFVA